MKPLPTEGVLYRGDVMSFLSGQLRESRALSRSFSAAAPGPEGPGEGMGRELESLARQAEDLLAKLKRKTYYRAGELKALSEEANRLQGRWLGLADAAVARVLDAAGEARLAPPYPLAREVWRAYAESASGAALPLGRAQAVFRRARDPAAAMPLLGRAQRGGRAGRDLLPRLARHTPLPLLEERTVWQVEEESTREGGSPHFAHMMELLGSPDPAERKGALAPAELLRDEYIQERWYGSSREPFAAHKALAALWRDISLSLGRFHDPAMPERLGDDSDDTHEFMSCLIFDY